MMSGKSRVGGDRGGRDFDLGERDGIADISNQISGSEKTAQLSQTNNGAGEEEEERLITQGSEKEHRGHREEKPKSTVR
jgi:hypothetical protein